MVRIRLARTGAKKRPFYHIVVADQRSRRDGRSIERVGYYNPIAAGQEIPLKISLDRVEYWQGHGAMMTDTVRDLVKRYRKEQAQAAPAA